MRKNAVLMKIVVVAIVIFALMFVAMPAVGAGDGGCDWTGTWDTNWGEMVLSQAGTQVSGSYTHDSGRITGALSGSTLIGTWSEAPSYSPPDDAGDVELTISPDCNSFTGKWRFGSTGGWSGGWTGTRSGAAPTPTPTITPTPSPGPDPESNWTVDDITPLKGQIYGVVPNAGNVGEITGEPGLSDPTTAKEKIEAQIAEIEKLPDKEREKYRDELARLYDQLYLVNRHEELDWMLAEGLITVTDKSMGLIPKTALVWGISTGLTTLIMGDFEDGMNRLIGAIPWKDIGTAYSVILELSNLLPDYHKGGYIPNPDVPDDWQPPRTNPNAPVAVMLPPI